MRNWIKANSLLMFFIISFVFAIRTPREENKMVFWFAVFWPITCIFMILLSITWAFKWDFDILPKKNWFGFRRPNDNWPGFAITIFKTEFCFWKKRNRKI